MHFEHRAGFLCAIMRFNFGMDDQAVSRCIAKASQRLLDAQDIRRPAMLYYQTDALLGFHPEELSACVTHHGPFVSDFIGRFPAEETGQAFGDAVKALHLLKYQELGLEKLRYSDRMFVLQHSHIQRRHLIDRGVDARRIRAVRPPIPVLNSAETLQGEKLCAFVTGAELLVFTAVARLDYFKNIELLVDASVQARQRGIPLRMLIVGDEADNDVRRRQLLRRVPTEHLPSFMATSKLSKPQLHALFREVRHQGLFVCPSRYETLGITPLEAALSGVCTLMTNSERVEAGRFFPATYRFEPSPAGLCGAIERIHYSDPGVQHMGKELQGVISEQISEEKFERDALSAWGHFSDTAQELTPTADLAT
ncbi:hypothetical protein CAC01_10755 [Streptomyces sp. CLI2509]|nr:glycosyltransferase [Streptomyces sp. SID8380]ASY33108.1 hypothetical protein CAC01_10755 [Streptomyces sp. CLI2509]